MRKTLRALLVTALILAGIAPARADRDVVDLVAHAPDRYVPHPAGDPVDLHYVFGPYVIPPGQDSNRVTVDMPVQGGYIVAVAPDLIAADDGRIPTQQEAHIHHAHWFRVTDDPNQEHYESLESLVGYDDPTDLVGSTGLSWVFGTGEEKTQGRLDDRARLAPENNDANPNNDFTYGIEVDGSTPTSKRRVARWRHCEQSRATGTATPTATAMASGALRNSPPTAPARPVAIYGTQLIKAGAQVSRAATAALPWLRRRYSAWARRISSAVGLTLTDSKPTTRLPSKIGVT